MNDEQKRRLQRRLDTLSDCSESNKEIIISFCMNEANAWLSDLVVNLLMTHIQRCLGK